MKMTIKLATQPQGALICQYCR